MEMEMFSDFLLLTIVLESTKYEWVHCVEIVLRAWIVLLAKILLLSELVTLQIVERVLQVFCLPKNNGCKIPTNALQIPHIKTAMPPKS